MLTSLKPLVGLIYLFVGIVYPQSPIQEGEEKLKEGKIDEARQIFENYNTEPVAIEYLGDIACFNKNWDEAIGYYCKLVDLDPSSAMYNFKLGGALGMKAYYGSRLEAALLINEVKEYLKKAADLDPTHKEARRALVELYMQIPGFLGGSEALAKSYASDLDRLNPIDALLADAYIFRKKNYRDLARKKYEEAISLAERKPELLVRNYLKYELGEGSAIFGIKLNTGKRLLMEYLQDYGYKDIKTPAWVYLRLAQIERERENREAALELIEKSLTLDNEFEKAREEKVKIQRL